MVPTEPGGTCDERNIAEATADGGRRGVVPGQFGIRVGGAPVKGEAPAERLLDGRFET